MAKNINMTRERKIALPIIIAAAEHRLSRWLGPKDKDYHALVAALEAFK